MDVSVVIPTFNREKDLEDVLNSILMQTKLPKQIIIVDDSDNYDTRNLFDLIHDKFLNKGITTKYIRKNGNRGITASKNISILHATGDVVLFSDDDVVLDKEFIKELLDVYETHPDAIGVQGYIVNDYTRTHAHKYAQLSRIIDNAYKIFLFERFEKDGCRILPSGNSTYPMYLPSRILKCQWISGTASYKKDVFSKFKFDEKLKKESLGEDRDFSYRIYKDHPTSLYMTPYAKFFHKASPSKLHSECKIYVGTNYPVYLFLKNIDQTLLNRFAFLWNNLGRLFINLVIMISKRQAKSIAWLIGSYMYLLKNFDEIKNGIFKFVKDDL
ncbi:glycosyltransferase family 2 protein [bacterium]|nr:MAG: glycosyltransferase family 2 protein [bacterium]